MRAAGVGSITVVTEGVGVTYNEAVGEALSEAIGQRMGRDVATETELQRAISSKVDDESVEAVATESVARRIQMATKGFVLGYKVLDKQISEEGLVTVKLEVLMPDFKMSAQADRLRIAVANLRTDELLVKYKGQLESAIKSALTESRKFAVLDRDWDREYGQEMNLLKSDQVPREERARLGQRLGTDLLLVGTLVDFSFVPASEATRLSQPVARGTFNFSLIDAATGQVKVAKVVNAKLSRLQAKQAGEGPQAALLKLAQEIGRQSADHIIEAAFPLTVVALQDAEIVINQGGDRLKVGQQYDLFKLGDALVDPQTGETIGRTESLAGSAVIVRVTPKISYAKVEYTAQELEVGIILRRSITKHGAPNRQKQKKSDNSW